MGAWAVAFLSGFYLVYLRSWPLLVPGILGILGRYWYTLGVACKYKGLGTVYHIRTQVRAVIIALVLLFITSPAEEIFWRGFLQKWAMDRYGATGGWLYRQTGNLAPCIISHCLWTVGIFLLFPVIKKTYFMQKSGHPMLAVMFSGTSPVFPYFHHCPGLVPCRILVAGILLRDHRGAVLFLLVQRSISSGWAGL